MKEIWLTRLLALSAPSLLATFSLLAGTGQPDETLPGFKANQAYQSGGVDHINLFTGDPGIVIPLGPEYPLSSGFTWQLRATYTSKIWTFDTYEGPPELRWAYVSGYPTLGVGWGLHLGFVDNGWYASPTTGRHYFTLSAGSYLTKDGSGLRLTGNGSPQYMIEFPDGSKHVFGHQFLRPRPSPEENPPTQDFSDDEHGGDHPRWGLTAILDRFGKQVLTVDYLDLQTGQPADAWKIWKIHLTPPPDFSGLERILVWNWGTWTNLYLQVWPVLNSIQFPSANGTLTVYFDRNTDLNASSFVRNNFDTAHLPGGTGVDGTVYPPELAAIRMNGNDGQGGSGELAKYGFVYNGTVSGNNLANGTLQQMTLPTGGRVSYTYAFTSGGGIGDRDLETTSCPPGGLALAPQPALLNDDAGTRFLLYVDRSAAVATRTETVSGLPDSITNYCRSQAAPPLPGDPTKHDNSRVARQVVVSRPDGNGSTISTRHIFSVEVLHNDYEPSNSGLELERRYYAGSDVTVNPIRSLVYCYDSDGPGYTHSCGYKDTGGNKANFVGINDIRRQNEATWYGVNPTGGADCGQTTSPACWQVSNTNWNSNALEYGTERTSSNSGMLLYDDTGNPTTTTSRYRDNTTAWAPCIDSTHWLLKIYTSKGASDYCLTGLCPNSPNTLSTSYSFNCTTPPSGFLNSYSILDNGYGTLSHSFTNDDGFGNSNWETASGTWSGAGSFVTHRTYVFGLPLTSSRSGLAVSWNSFDVTRDVATGLITASRDPNGLSTSYVYDAFGRLTSVTLPGGEAPTTYCYQPWNSATGRAAYVLAKKGAANPCSTNDGTPSEGTASSDAFVFDGNGRLVREFRRSPNTLWAGAYFSFRETRYNTAGLVSVVGEWSACPSGTDVASCFSSTASYATSFSNFDFLGRARTITLADGNVSTRSFDDPSGLVPNSDFTEMTTVNNVGGQTAYGGTRKDVLGRALIVTDPGPAPFGPYACHSYNTLDKLVSLSVACGGSAPQGRSFSYDLFGFLRSETHPEKGTTSYPTYDALGDVTKKQEGGLFYAYTYDTLGRLLTLNADAQPTPTTAYVQNWYDGTAGPTGGSPKGRLSRRIGFNPSTTDKLSFLEDFTYGGLGGRLSLHQTTMRDASLQTLVSASQNYAYSTLGFLEATGYPRTSGSFSTTTTYKSGLPARILVGSSPVVSASTYNQAGGLASYTTGNGVRTTIDQDNSKMPRPRQISSSGASANWSTGVYAYDGAGNVTAMGTDTFSYDYRSRLTRASFNSVSGAPYETFTYDDFGNMTQRYWSGTGGGTVLLTTSVSTNRLTGASYDNLGNLISYGTDSFSFDALSRRWRWSSGTPWEEYSYDASGERLARKSSSASSYYLTLRDEASRTLTEYRYDITPATSTLLKDYVYFGNLLVATNTTSGGTPLGWVYYSSDHLGSPRLLTNPSRTTIATYRYRAFGLPLSTSFPAQGPDFASMEKDATTGHHYDHARFYGGWFARFNSPDKVGGKILDPQSWNRYAYTRNNPLKNIDPNGLETVTVLPDVYLRLGTPESERAANIAFTAAILGVTAPIAGAAALPGSVVVPGLTAQIFRVASIAARGRQVEAALAAAFGGALNRSFPVIDRFLNGVATSVKSVDLLAKSYQDPARLSSLLTGYVDKLANFQGATFARQTVAATDITKRVLEVVIEKGAGSPQQLQTIQDVSQYAQRLGVELQVILAK